MVLIVGLTTVCIIAAILLVHFTCSYAPKKVVPVQEPDTALTRLERHYFEDAVYAQQQNDLLSAERRVEEIRQKGLIDEFPE